MTLPVDCRHSVAVSTLQHLRCRMRKHIPVPKGYQKLPFDDQSLPTLHDRVRPSLSILLDPGLTRATGCKRLGLANVRGESNGPRVSDESVCTHVDKYMASMHLPAPIQCTGKRFSERHYPRLVFGRKWTGSRRREALLRKTPSRVRVRPKVDMERRVTAVLESHAYASCRRCLATTNANSTRPLATYSPQVHVAQAV